MRMVLRLLSTGTYIWIRITVQQSEASLAWTLVDSAAIAARCGKHLWLVLAQQRVESNAKYIRAMILLDMCASCVYKRCFNVDFILALASWSTYSYLYAAPLLLFDLVLRLPRRLLRVLDAGDLLRDVVLFVVKLADSSYISIHRAEIVLFILENLCPLAALDFVVSTYAARFVRFIWLVAIFHFIGAHGTFVHLCRTQPNGNKQFMVCANNLNYEKQVFLFTFGGKLGTQRCHHAIDKQTNSDC